MYTRFDALPPGLLEVAARELHRVLPGPSLIHLPGRRREPLFVAVLLHGNEDTGLRAVQQVLRSHAGSELPRALSLFVGNVAAAREGVRRLAQEPDYNRIWPGAPQGDAPHYAMAQGVLEEMRARGVFACIDIHNNTGLNPLYACTDRLDRPFLHLARLFARTAVYFTRPKGVLSAAFSALCPAIAVECGKAGYAANEAHAAEFVEACLHLAEFPQHAVAKQDLDLYHTVAIAKVKEAFDFSFGSQPAEIQFRSDLDHLNFRLLEAGTPLARLARGGLPLTVSDEAGNDVSEQYFEVGDGMLRLRRSVVPAMLTRDPRAIRLDCLCYFMARLAPDRSLSSPTR